MQLATSGVALAFGSWWTLLSVLALRRPSEGSRAGSCGLRWVVIVPAHNEEDLIAATVESLRTAGATPDEILVVADNCSDETAARALLAGATVLERDDLSQRGKSHAIDFALEWLRLRPAQPDAVLLVDADTEVSAGIFGVVAARLERGARVVQVHYEGAAGDAPVARLRRLALALVHWSRPLGAARLGLPATLKGNGMAFRWSVLKDGFPGSGITEDAAATLNLLRRGELVVFEPRAAVSGRMATSYAAARTQDMRWEGGRLALIPSAIAEASRHLAAGRLRASAAALELASLPLTLTGVLAAAGLAIALGGYGSMTVASVSIASLLSYVLIGLAAARPDRGDLLALVHAPRFVAHKLRVFARLTRGQPRSWERTTR